MRPRFRVEVRGTDQFGVVDTEWRDDNDWNLWASAVMICFTDRGRAEQVCHILNIEDAAWRDRSVETVVAIGVDDLLKEGRY